MKNEAWSSKPSSSLPAVLWRKSLHDSRLLFVSLAAVLLVFNWIFVWLSSQVDLGALGLFLKSLPEAFERMAGVPFSSIATPTGRLGMAYVDPVTMFVAISWCIARGSDCVSGEIGRGTMELLMAQPVPRRSIVIVHAIVVSCGAMILAALTWLGLWLGLATVGLTKVVAFSSFLPAGLNYFGFMFFLAAFTTLVSACGSDRRRTIGILGGFYLIQLLMKVVARTAKGFEWLMYGTFLGAYEPQALVIHPATAWQELIWRDGMLIGLGVACYVAAAAVFERRDLPAPL